MSSQYLYNTTSCDIKYYAYIPNIWREGKKFLYKMDISLVLRDIVVFYWCCPCLLWLCDWPWRLLVLVFTDSDQNYWYKLYQIENLGFKVVSDNDLEILLGQWWWCEHQCILVTNVVTHSFSSYQCSDNAAKLMLPRQAMTKLYSFSP